VALALVVAGSAGCNAQWGPYAARVNGSSVSPGQLNGALASVAHSSYKCVLNAETQGKLPITGAGVGDGSYSIAFADFILTALVKAEVAASEVAVLHLPEPASARSLAVTQVIQGLQQAAAAFPACQTSGEKILAALSSTYRNSIVGYQLDSDALAAHLAGTTLNPASLAAYEVHNATTTSQSCTSIIEVASKSKAASIRHRVLAGASFATEAKSNSLDTNSAANGGSVGCILASALVAQLRVDLEHLPVGQVSQPIKFQSGWLLLLVTKRQFEPVDQLVNQLFSSEQTALQKVLEDSLRRARIQVASNLGHWDSSYGGGSGDIVVPAGPKADFVPNPSGAVGKPSPAPGSGGLATSGTAGTGTSGG
jgi:parvulin-like peptidyl-prolyl isomerase